MTMFPEFPDPTHTGEMQRPIAQVPVASPQAQIRTSQVPALINTPTNVPLMQSQPDPFKGVESSQSSYNSTINSHPSLATYIDPTRPSTNMNYQQVQHMELMNQMYVLTQSNLESQKLVTNLQTQVAQLMHQNNQLVNQVINLNQTQTHPNHNPSLLHSATQKQPSIPTTIDLLSYEENTPTIISVQDLPSATQPLTPTINPQSQLNVEVITQLAKLSKSTNEHSKRRITFPKFSGKDFHAWYDSIISILSSPSWKELYDATTDDAIAVEPETDASAELYTSIKSCLQGDAQTTMLNKKGVRGKGIEFLQLIKATFDPKLSTVERDSKQREFLTIARNKDESVDTYGARCITIKEELRNNGIVTTQAELKTRFIMGLGPEFTTIKTALNEQNLPPKWETDNIETLFRVASSYLNTQKSIQLQNAQYKESQNKLNKPKDQKKDDAKDIKEPNPNQNRNAPPQNARAKYQDRDKERQTRIFRDLQNGTFNPETYKKEVRQGACIYHGTHHVGNCRAMDALMERFNHRKPNSIPLPPQIQRPDPVLPSAMAKQASVTPTHPVPMTNVEVHGLQEHEIATAAEQLLNFEMQLNDNNSNVNHYSTSSSMLSLNCKHVQLTDPVKNNNEQNLHFVVDSGAYPHMWTNKSSFITYAPWTPECKFKSIKLADGVSTAKIEGIGSIIINMQDTLHVIDQVLYVPSLSTSLLSVKAHCQKQGQIFHCENNHAILTFPKNVYTAKCGNEITFNYKIPTRETILQFLNKIHSPVQPQPQKSKDFNVANAKYVCGVDQPTSTKMIIKTIKLKDDAIMPKKSSENAAGYDIFANEQVSIEPGDRSKISTGIAMEIPKGYYGRIASRSSLALKCSLDIAGGVIDSDYRGEIFPIIVNNSLDTCLIDKTTKIAQIIITKIGDTEIREADTLTPTTRNKGGFGSTDITEHRAVKFKDTVDLNKFKSTPQKITIKLPWKDEFIKTTIQESGDNYRLNTEDTCTLFPKAQIQKWYEQHKIMIGHTHKITKPIPNPTAPLTYVPPPIRPIDKPITNATKNITLNMNQLQKGFGFRNVSSMINELQETSTNLVLSTLDKEPIIDIGETASIDRPKRNTTPLDLPHELGDVVHMDILFGAKTSIGGYKYALFIVDRATRHKFIYPIRSLKHDILECIKSFCADINRTPKLIRTDFDHKIIGKSIQNYIREKGGRIESAPPHLQSQNGLCERNWRSLLKMARNWLTSSLLPSKFWWHALKRATEVSNYVPLRINGRLTTPHQEVFHQKVDMRNIIPMFTVSYIDYKDQKTFNIQTTKAILIGKSNKSNILEFFHPPTNSIISSTMYKLDESLVAGPTFNLPYDGGFHFNKYCESNVKIRPPTYTPESYVYIKHNERYIKCKVITVPMIENDIYTLQLPNGTMHQTQESHIHSINPQNPEPDCNTLPTWLKHEAKVTLYLNSNPRPQHGTILKSNDKWYFRPGSKVTNPAIELTQFEPNARHLIQSHQIFQGHPPFSRIILAKQTFDLSNAVAKHVSAASLSSSDVPTLINHCKLSENDKKVWDAAYAEEYMGLQNLPAWISITDKEYQKMKHIYKSILPTMAISTIKYDELGNPKRAKYRIVALGNLDPHEWSKSECYAPVMNLLELRLITALAVRMKRKLKSGDVKQAFVQALLPDTERYVLRPPPGCPLTPPNTYWLLRRTLYGLKRSPKHWYDKATQMLATVGLKQCPNAPCMFTGQIIQGKPPLILGLYVDDFVYFSTDDDVEKEFEERLKKLTSVDFMGTVSHFLGIRFQWRETDTDLHVHMSQQAFAEHLIAQAGLHTDSTTSNPTPYRSGFPIDKVPHVEMSKERRQKLETELRSYVGSLLWLSQGTRPDLATVTNMLAKYQNCPSPGHISAAKYAIKYLKGSTEYGIKFTNTTNIDLLSFVNFPIQRKTLTGIADANWGPQDQSVPHPDKTYPDLEFFKSRSISGHIIVLHGPLHWQSKRQKITARSSAEAEIYATDQCVKDLIYLKNVLFDLDLKSIVPQKTKVYNDNMACVHWSKSKTTKGLRYIQLRENSVRENKNISVEHIAGKSNPADMFSKEDKDPAHFKRLRNMTVQQPFPIQNLPLNHKLPHELPSKTTKQVRFLEHNTEIETLPKTSKKTYLEALTNKRQT